MGLFLPGTMTPIPYADERPPRPAPRPGLGGRGTPRPGRPTVPDYDPSGPKAQRHSRTSVEAARLMRGRAGTMRAAIYRWLLDRGERGATDEEGQESMGLGPNSYRPRRIELTEAGLAADTGQTRLTHARRRAVVWRAVRPEGA